MRNFKQSVNSVILNTYGQLRAYIEAFAAGHINLLILVGTHGLAKSRTVKEILGDRACWIEGNASAFGIYQALYQHRDRFVVMDDVDSLYADKHGIRLLKCLCQTEPSKVVGWHTATRALERNNIPREFSTSSKVIIICNDWKTLNRNVAALQDRGHVVEFRPNALEVHKYAERWFADTEILAWFRQNMDAILEPSLRHYVRAAELKLAGLDWHQTVPSLPQCRRRQLVVELRSDASYPTEESRVRAFVSRGGGCRATYFNHAKKVRELGPDWRICVSDSS